jgi:PAS domain S-box-containing protein
MKNPIRVLVIEDNEDDSILEIQELRKGGFTVEYERVETREACKAALLEQEWDCIISDYSMPQFSGLDALNELKLSGKDIPFILISGVMGEEKAVEAMTSGARDYIMKDNLKRLVPALVREIREAEIRRQKRSAEESIRYERILLRTLIDNLPNAIYFKDTNCCRIISNDSDLEYLGFSSEDEVIGKADTMLLDKNIGKMSFADDQKILATGEAVINREEEYFDHKGKHHWILTTKIPIRNESGMISGIVGLGHDITERKKAEFALMESERSLAKQNHEYEILNKEYLSLNDELRQSFEQIQRINAELVVAKNRAEESDKLKSAFLANMSHEIRTPLNAILGFSQYLKDEELEQGKTEQYIDIIESSGNQLLTIINDILDISQIEAGHLIINPRALNIYNLCHDLYKQYKGRAKGNSLQMSLNIDQLPSNLEVLTDENRLRQVLSNLLDNAFKFTTEGNIELGCSLQNEQLEFYVKDTGIGIAPENLAIIFKPFRQVEITETRSYRGNGLGLSISKALIDKLGGSLTLTSEPGKGSDFRFRIPVIPVNAINKENKPTGKWRAPSDWNKYTILVVEDEVYNFSYLEKLLSSTNVNILHAWDGREAVDLVSKNPDISLVLMDIRMPVMDGYTATSKIKDLRPDLPVIAQTAFAFSEDKEKAMKVGFDNYITKPSPRNLVVDVIGEYLS